MQPPFDDKARRAVIVAAVTLAVSGVGFRSAVVYLNVFLRKEAVPLRQPLVTIPRVLGPWKAVDEDILLDEISTEQLGTDKYLLRRYARDDSEMETELSLHVAYYTGMIDAVPHIPDRCFVAGGWNPTALTRDHPLDVTFPEAAADPVYTSAQTGDAYRCLRRRHPVTGLDEVIRLPFGDYEMRTVAFARKEVPAALPNSGNLFPSAPKRNP